MDQPVNQSINQLDQTSTGGQHATVAVWREHEENFDNYSANNFDTRTLKANHNIESYFWTWSFDLLVYLKYLAISDETWKHPIWIYLKYIIITIITTITTIITIITLRIIPNKILGTGDLFCGPSHHHCPPPGVPCLGAPGFEVRILERGEGDVRSLGLGIWQGWFKMTRTQFLQRFWIGPKWDFRVWSHPLGFTRDSSQ